VEPVVSATQGRSLTRPEPSRKNAGPAGVEVDVSNLSIPLSVLDLAPVGSGSTPADALHQAASLAEAAEALGYRRYWVAEHHNMPGIASSSPAVLLAHVAAATRSIRVGSGGVMLPNHAPLVVAEQFGMLEALHPGRVDLGIGRAPGTDQVTAAALRRTVEGLSADDFPRALGELLGFFDGQFPEGHPYRQITAVPGLGYRPAMWLLGSSDYSAQVAGILGLPFSFAHHFAAAATMPALAAYRSTFRPSDELAEPYVMLGVAVLCADTDERARWLAGSGALAMARLRQGRPGVYPTPEEAAEHVYSPLEKQIIGPWRDAHVVGDPEQVRAGLAELVARTGADELIITTMAHGYEDRLRSYQLVAEALELDPLDPLDHLAGASGSGHG
jgi:luciferase family oxidoreductase group 1